MIWEGFSLAILTTTGWIMLFSKLPPKIQEFIVKYSLFTDIVALFATYYLLGGGVTAMFAAAIVDILISVALHIANHKADYIWIFDAFEMIKNLMEQGSQYLKHINEEYKSTKAVPAPIAGI